MLIVLIAALGPALLILWHDLWLESDGFAAGLLRVRVGSGAPFVSSEPVTGDARFAARLLADAAGVRTFEAISKVEGSYRTFGVPLETPGSALIALTTHPRRITLAADKFHAYLVEEGLAHAEEQPPAQPVTEEYCKHAKLLVSRGVGPVDAWLKPVGLTLEVVPVHAQCRVGERGGFRVLFREQPLPHFGLWYVRSDGRKSLHRCDSYGVADIPFDLPGKAVLKGIHLQRVDHPELQYQSWWCSLSCDVHEADA